MFALVGGFLVAVLVVGTATLSGHPLPVIAIALLVGGAILAVMWRVRRLSDPRSGTPRSAASGSAASGSGGAGSGRGAGR